MTGLIPAAVLAARHDDLKREAIALAREINAFRVILDDEPARRFAIGELGLPVIGTVGVVLAAKLAGMISEVHSTLAALVSVGFRISDNLPRDVLTQANER